MSDTPTVTQQYAFTVSEDGDTDGGIEPAEESVETSLEAFGADVDHCERDTRIDQPEASSFGVDDRATVTRSDGGEQRALFADTDDDQRTLTGKRAASQCLFESDDGDTEPADTASDELTVTNTEASPRAVATDGGRAEDDDTIPENGDASKTVMVAIPRKELAGVADALDAERETIKRHAGEGSRTEKLARYVEECRTGLSVLDDTDETGKISRVAAAATADELQAATQTETGEYAEELQRLSDVLRRELADQSPSDENAEVDHDSDREPITDGGRENTPDEAEPKRDEKQDTTFDADAETVTEAWEGAYIQASWGYNQTNVELAQIVEVSDSGKTVLARFVAAERVGHGRTSKQLQPTAEQYGDEFRLHVRSPSDDPAFRGTYPLGSDGDMDGPTRRGTFYLFDNRAEKSIRETTTGFGH
jgi:hypothetical protein